MAKNGDVGKIPLRVYFYYGKGLSSFWRDSSFRECPVEGARAYNTLWPHGMPQEVSGHGGVTNESCLV
jgi:hypothetical protein